MSDAVNKPTHYNQGSIECIEAMKIVLTQEEFRGYLKGNVFKYLWREKDKNGIEDLKKAKWYLDRLIESFEANKPEQPAIKQSLTTKPPDGWRPNDNVALAMQMAANSFGGKDGVFNGANFSNAMRQLSGVTCNLDGHVVASILEGRSDVEVLKGGSHYRYLFYESISSSQKPAEPPKPTAEVTGEVTGEVKHPLGCPDGWRFLEVGEVIRKGDRYFDGDKWKDRDWAVKETYSLMHQKTIRRNRFEVGEKVIGGLDGFEFVVVGKHSRFDDVYVVRNKTTGTIHNILDRLLAPYIEEIKPTVEVAGEVTGEVKNPLGCPDGWRWLEVGEVIRKGDKYRDLKSQTWIEVVAAIGDSLQDFHKPTIRRNRFEVGEKVVRLSEHCKVYEVQVRAGGEFVMLAGFDSPVNVNELAPYIEEAT